MSPPEALAVLADAMSRSPPLDSRVLLHELDRSEPDASPPEEWLLPGTALCSEIAAALGGWPPQPPATAQDFARCAAALQRLDRWHRPLLPSETGLPRQIEHEMLLDRMALEDRFNANPDYGTVIARQAFGSPFLRLDAAEPDWDAVPSAYGVLCSLLDICVFLPVSVEAGDPDTDSSIEGSRRIGLTFRRFSPEEPGLPWPPDMLRIALAPVVETEDDARFWVEGDRYAIEPTVPFARFEALIQGALAAHAHFLLLPEMTVDSSHLPRLTETLRNLRRAAAHADRARLPDLRLALIGVIEAPRVAGGPHRNYIAAISGNGEILFTQDKLSHWNLDAGAQSRFGLDGKGFPVPLRENTIAGTNIMVAEFDGIGRVMALICADMSHNMPGDWIADNIGLDWLYAPIMDGSTCWLQGRAPWIVHRAVRTCTRAGTTVMIANSMAMTHWNNRVIARHKADPSYPYRTYEACGIGFIARREGLETVIQHIKVELGTRHTPVLQIIDWSTGWNAPPAT
jgi:predicted amidohydrolase